MREMMRPVALLLAFASCAALAGDAPVTATVNGAEVANSSAASPATAKPSSCVNRCNIAETKCSSQVRRARQDCSRKAATGGRDPFSGRNEDYASFCGYFSNSLVCGTDGRCKERYAQRHGVCIDRMQDNIALQRHDCVLNEREAQNFCREELRDCQTACEETAE